MFRIILALAAAALITPAVADDSISEFPAGGLAFKDAVDIAIAREDLHLGIEQVTIRYDYSSAAEAKLHETMEFAMPLVPIDGSASELGGDQTLADPTNYMNFSARAGGKKVKLMLHGHAWFQGADITAELKGDGIPAYLPYEDIEGVMGKVKPAVADDLVKRGLILRNDDGSYGEPQWLYQSVFDWQQDFAPGTTRIDVTYTPLVGSPDAATDYYVKDPDHKYCVGRRQLDKIAKYAGGAATHHELTLGYLATTATNAQGPIGAFNLTIDKQKLSPADQLVDSETAFCNMPSMQEDAAAFTWSATNYVPDRDIDIVWFGFYDLNAPLNH